MNEKLLLRLNLRFISLSLFLITFFSGQLLAQTSTVIPAGSYIIDMGKSPQTVNNALKPYGLVYAIIKHTQTPVEWVIKSGKTTYTGVDFTHNGKSYKGGPFVISQAYRNTQVDSIINKWKTLYSGLTVDTTVSTTVVPVYKTLSYFPIWTLDAQNGGIAQGYLTAAGIPSSAYNWVSPQNLTCCNDLFVMPHADPVWSTHSNLLNWNDDTASGGCSGWIWAACHAVSALENTFNPSSPTQQLNFLSEKTGTANPANSPWAKNSLILWGDHDDGDGVYTTESYYSRPEMQLMSDPSSVENGSEQIYIPYIKWRNSTYVAIHDPNHPDIPAGTSSKAAKLAFGRAFGDDGNGKVMYEAGHNHGGTGVANVAAQRAFLNFSLEAPESKIPTITTSVPAVMQGGNTYQLTSHASGKTGPYTYSWTAGCAGSFDNPYIKNPKFTPDSINGDDVNCAVAVSVTDACGRITFNSSSLVISEGPHPPLAVKDSAFCNPWATVTLNALSNDSDPDGDPITASAISSLTTSKGVFTMASDGTVTYDPASSFTSGTDTLTYQICDTTGLCDTAIVVIEVNYPDSDGDGIYDNVDIDDDNDGITDVNESGVTGKDPSGDEDGDGIPNFADATPGTGITWLDANNDGVNDYFDWDKDGIPDHLDIDSDNDGITDAIEANGGIAPTNYNTSTGMITGAVGANGLPDAIETGSETGVSVYTPGDKDGDGHPNYKDIDSDNDGITDAIEANGGTAPTNYSASTGTIVTTVGSNGWPDSADPSAGGTALPLTNSDADALKDFLDIDADNDGIVDNIEAQSTAGYVGKTGTDTDGDGWDDAYDPDNGGTPITIYNHDGTDLPDYRDTDSDNDGVLDIREGHDNNSNGTADWDTSTANDVVDAGENSGNATKDTDNDGLLDLFDPTYISCSYTAIFDQGSAATNSGGCAAVQNTDGTDDRDWRDIDDDIDGILTSAEPNDLLGGLGTSPNGIKDYLESPCAYGYIANAVNDTLYPTAISCYNLSLGRGGDCNDLLVANGDEGDMKDLNDSAVYTFATTSSTASIIRTYFTQWESALNLSVYRSTNGTSWVLDTTFLGSVHANAGSGSVAYSAKGSFKFVKLAILSSAGGDKFKLDAIRVERSFIECIISLDAVKDSSSTFSNVPVTIAVQDNDINNTTQTDLNVTILDSLLNHGSVTVNLDGTVDYTPSANYVGLDSFYYTICTGGGVCDTALVVVLVQSNPCGPGKSGTLISTPAGFAYAVSIESYTSHVTPVVSGNDCIGAPPTSLPASHEGTQFAKDLTGGGNFVVKLGQLVPAGTIIKVFGNGHDLASNKQNTFNISSSTTLAGTYTGTSSYAFVNQHSLDSFSYTAPAGGAQYLRITRTDNGLDFLAFNGFRYDSVTVTNTCTNPAPIAVNDTVTTTLNTTKVSSIATNDYDPLGDELVFNTAPITGLTNGGGLTISTAGLVTFTPVSNWTGIDSFRYRVCDTASPALCDTAWYFVSIINNPPVAVNDYTSVEAGFPVSLNILTNDNEPDGQPLSLDVPALSVNGGLISVGENGEITYLPGISQSGLDSFQYIICDGQTPNLCDTAWVIINVSAYFNDPPVANRDAAYTEKNESIEIVVLTNDTEPEGEALDVTTAGTDGADGATFKGGTVSVNYDNTLAYTPPTGWFGTDSFFYIITDAYGNFDTTTVVVIVEEEVNDPPVARDDYMVAYWNPAGAGSGVTTYVSPFNNDYDEDGNLDSSAYSGSNLIGVEVITSPTKGTVTWNPATGEFAYIPTTSITDGTLDSFMYKVCDDGTPLPAQCDTAWVYITMYNDNDAPTANRDNDQTYVNQRVYIDVKSNDVDPENSPVLTRSVGVSDSASNGSVYFTASGRLAYTPDAGFVGMDTVVYTLCDDGGAIQKCDTALVVITVLNNAVIASPDDASTTLNSSVTIDIRANDVDPDGHQFWISDLAPNSAFSSGDTLNGSSTALGGTVSVNDNGTPGDPTDDFIDYTPPSNAAGVVDTFWYQACDTVSAPNQGCAVTYALITIAENSKPIALDDYDTTLMNNAVVVDVLANDYDLTGNLVPSTVAIILGGNPTQGAVSINVTTGEITYTPGVNFEGLDSFTYVVCDDISSPNTKCDTATVYINVINQRTLAQDDINATLVNKAVSGDVTTNDSDPDGDSQTFGSFLNQTTNVVISTGATLSGADKDGNAVATAGSLSFDANGVYTFTPAIDFTGTVQVPYNICDNGIPSACDTATLTINVEPIPDPQTAALNTVLANNDYALSFGNAVTSNVLSNDADAEGNTFTATSFTCDADGDGTPETTGTIGASAVTVGGINQYGAAVTNAGTLSLASDGTYVFTPTNGFVGDVYVDYEITDNGSTPATDEAQLHIAVYKDNGATVNDPPVAGDDYAVTRRNKSVTGDWLSNDYESNGENIRINGVATNIDPSNPSANTTTLVTLTTVNGGTVVIKENGTYTYTPATGYTGPDQVSYEICDVATNDPKPLCDSATIYLMVTPYNKTLAIDDDNSTIVNTDVSGNVTTNDFDPEGDTQTFGSFLNQNGNNITTGATLSGTDADGNAVANAGTISFDANGAYTYSPATDFVGAVQVPYVICDNGVPSRCDTALLVISVKDSLDPTSSTSNGIFANDDDAVSYGNAVSSKALTNDGDPESDTITISSYKFDTNGDGSLDGTGTLGTSITVGGIDDDGNSVSNAGTLLLDSLGNYTFTPSAGFTGDVKVKYTLCDDNTNQACTDAFIYIHVYTDNGVANDPPLAGDDFATTGMNVPKRASWIGNDMDYNGDSIRINGVAVSIDPTNASVNSDTIAIDKLTTLKGGTVKIYPNGEYVYTPPTDYTGPDRVSYQICDVTSVNPQPLCDSATIYLVVNSLVRDYGDLPLDKYSAAWNVFKDDDNNGIPEGTTPVWLGAFVTNEVDTRDSGNAQANTDSDDGVIVPSTIDTVNQNIFKVIVNSTVPNTKVYFKMYIDWDQNGTFDSTYVGFGTTHSPDTVPVAVMAPGGEDGQFYLRVRVSLDSGLITPNGGANNGETEDYMGNITPVPVKLTYFNAVKDGRTSLLTWQTASEENNDRFEIERKSENGNWEKVGEVKGAGNSQALLNYQWIDYNPIIGVNYYRLRQVDFDGQFEYSKLRAVSFDGGTSVLVYPNPATTSVNVVIAGNVLSDVEVSVTDVFGKEVLTKRISKNRYNSNGLKVDLTGLRHGYYFVRVTTGTESNVSRILIQR
jgi:hypothetical protein